MVFLRIRAVRSQFTGPSSREWRNTLQNTAGTLTPSCLYATMTGPRPNFHAAGVECGRLPQMLTTTLHRLRDAGVAGTGVWFYYGLPRTLASLALSGRSLFLLVISSIASSSLSRQEASRHQNRLCIPGTGENHGAQPFGPTLIRNTLSETHRLPGCEPRGSGQNGASPPSGGHHSPQGQRLCRIPRPCQQAVTLRLALPLQAGHCGCERSRTNTGQASAALLERSMETQ